MLYVVCCMLYVACYMLHVVCYMLYVVCCMLYVEVWDVAVCAGHGRADYSIENIQVHALPMYHRGRVREDGLEIFWRSCKLAALAGAAVMIHCNQSFHRGPLGLVAIMIRAGYAKHRAIEMVAEQRSIFPGHWVPFRNGQQLSGSKNTPKTCLNAMSGWTRCFLILLR